MKPRAPKYVAMSTAILAGFAIVPASRVIGQSPLASTPRPPASSLAAPTSVSKPPDAAGFIRRWLVLEPIVVPPQLGETAVQALVRDARFAEPRTAMPSAGQRVAIGDQDVAWHALDTLGYNVNLFHFAYALGRPTSNVLFWTVTIVEAPRDLPGVRLAIGSNAASVWWLNDEMVIGLYNDRQTVIDDGVSKRVTLKKGRNVIRAMIVNGGGATDFCARFLDEAGNPVKEFTTRLASAATGR
jgi:hypothetical protein